MKKRKKVNPDFAFSYVFENDGYAFSGEPNPSEATRIERMIKQLKLFSTKKNLKSGHIYVDFQQSDNPVITFFDVPKGLQDDIVDVIYNKAAT
jgi:hypothetical protein